MDFQCFSGMSLGGLWSTLEFRLPGRRQLRGRWYLIAPAQAGILPGEDLSQPGVGDGNGDDSDHPWGGDNAIGGPGTVPKTYKASVLTGFFPVDVLVNVFITNLYGEPVPADSKQSQAATLSSTSQVRSAETTLLPTRKHAAVFRKER